MLVLVTGAACLVVLLRRVGLGLVEALALGALFVTSSNVVNRGTSIWSQTASVFLIPAIFMILAASVGCLTGALRSRWRVVRTAWSSLLSQDYYTGAFTALLLAVLVVVPALISSVFRESGMASRSP